MPRKNGIGTHLATDIANSSLPAKVGMALTARKTIATFMRYVHINDDQARKAAELGAKRRQTMVISKPV
ncbi:hypothetical protein BV921_04010 [Pectobacterium odoriferum]|nr:hypothetical protein BV921_04010 [Pectobacterium odoriferum]